MDQPPNWLAETFGVMAPVRLTIPTVVVVESCLISNIVFSMWRVINLNVNPIINFLDTLKYAFLIDQYIVDSVDR